MRMVKMQIHFVYFVVRLVASLELEWCTPSPLLVIVFNNH